MISTAGKGPAPAGMSSVPRKTPVFVSSPTGSSSAHAGSHAAKTQTAKRRSRPFSEGTLADVLLQKLQRARARELGALGVVRAPLVTVEAVPRGIDERGHFLVLALELLHAVDRDRLVGLAPMAHHRTLGLLARVGGDAAAVVGHRG